MSREPHGQTVRNECSGHLQSRTAGEGRRANTRGPQRTLVASQPGRPEGPLLRSPVQSITASSQPGLAASQTPLQSDEAPDEATLMLGQWDMDENDSAAPAALQPAMGSPAAHLRELAPFRPTAAQWAAHFSAAAVEAPWEPANDCTERILRVKRTLSVMEQGPPAKGVVPPPPQAGFDQRLRRWRAPKADMRAGRFNKLAPVFEALAERTATSASQAREVREIREGIKLLKCSPEDPQKSREPHHSRKTRGVAMSVREAGYDEAAVQRLLRRDWYQGGASPGPAFLGNRLTSVEELEFAVQAVAKLEQTQAVVRWPRIRTGPFAGTRPHTVLPLARAVSASGKERLILDARYTIRFLQYFRCSFESLRSAIPVLTGSQWGYVLDLKSGYHHFLVTPEDWTFLGFELNGVLYCFAALPFGVSQALYTAHGVALRHHARARVPPVIHDRRFVRRMCGSEPSGLAAGAACAAILRPGGRLQ